ncbi:hypothetical protein ACN6K9_003217 [Streptomyces sp. SAS_267]
MKNDRPNRVGHLWVAVSRPCLRKRDPFDERVAFPAGVFAAAA